MRYMGVKIPKCNGHPQLWSREEMNGLRIIYPDGKVEYTFSAFDCNYYNTWNLVNGCTSSFSQLSAIRECIDYEYTCFDCLPEFLGYL